MVCGHEQASIGTIYLQGFLQTPGRSRFRQVKRWMELPGIHLEISRTKPQTDRDYCHKDDPDGYYESGEL